MISYDLERYNGPLAEIERDEELYEWWAETFSSPAYKTRLIDALANDLPIPAKHVDAVRESFRRKLDELSEIEIAEWAALAGVADRFADWRQDPW